MTEFLLPRADVRVVLHHMAAYGLASILDEAKVADLRLSWTTGAQPIPRLTAPDLSADLVDRIVREHAANHADDRSWINRDLPTGGTPRGLMSPRLGSFPDKTAWREVQAARHHELDQLTTTAAVTDLRFLAALGEPCYWSHNRKGDPLQDDGASRWEMQPRNQGSEFVGSRLRKLVIAVARRAPGATVAGITGASAVDEIGGDRADSRTPTGLAAPGPTDNALAWCALWGIGQFPIAPRINATALTSGHLGRGGAGWFYAPVWHSPWKIARLRTILASNALRDAAAAGLGTPWSVDPPRQVTARGWLATRGVAGIIRFPVERFGSISAPERRAMRGTPIPVTPT
jgi:CRISPR-associated protein Csb3